VLIVDVDPQGNLTSGVGRKGQPSEAGSIYDALTDRPNRRPMRDRSSSRRISIACSSFPPTAI
jgi:cellulose biosynthesis protein BcsQ